MSREHFGDNNVRLRGFNGYMERYFNHGLALDTV